MPSAVSLASGDGAKTEVKKNKVKKEEETRGEGVSTQELLRAAGSSRGGGLCPCACALAHTVANRASVSCWSFCVRAVPTPRLVISESTLGSATATPALRDSFAVPMIYGLSVISQQSIYPAQWYLLSCFGRTGEVSHYEFTTAAASRIHVSC